MIRSYASVLYKLTKTFIKVRWIKTFRVNFSLLPFNQAVKLPIIVTGKLIIDSLAGKAIINAPVKFGIINIGRDMDNMPIASCPARLRIDGKIIFNGYTIISQSANVCVWKAGTLELGRYSRVLSGVLLKSSESVFIGDFTRVTSGCFIMDTNVHYIKNTVTGLISRNSAPIIIGKYCWLTMNTSVTAGAKIPDYCITARGSLINKDFTNICEPGTMLAGAPAKPIRNNLQRIFSDKKEMSIKLFFQNNQNDKYYQSNLGLEIENEEDILKEFLVL